MSGISDFLPTGPASSAGELSSTRFLGRAIEVSQAQGGRVAASSSTPVNSSSIFEREVGLADGALIKTDEAVKEAKERLEHLLKGDADTLGNWLKALPSAVLSGLLGLTEKDLPDEKRQERIEAIIANFKKDENGNNALVAAADRGDAQAVRHLLSLPGIDVNAKGQFGNTPLIAAAYRGKNEAFRVLMVEPSVDPSIVNDYGNTALMFAACELEADTVAHLLRDPQVDINAVNEDGVSAIVFAAADGKMDNVDLLLGDPRINLSIVTTDGVTTLSLIARNSSISCVREVLKRALLKAEYVATILSNFISLRPVFQPFGAQNAFFKEMMAEGTSSVGLSFVFLMEAWREFSVFTFAEEYKLLEEGVKGNMQAILQGWEDEGLRNDEALAQAIAEGKPCAWTVIIPEHLMGMSVGKDQLIFSNLGGDMGLLEGRLLREKEENELSGEMIFDISTNKELFTPEFIGQLRAGSLEAIAKLYEVCPRVGYIGKRGQNRSNCAFVHPKVLFENQIYFSLLGNEEQLPSGQSALSASSGTATSSQSVSSGASGRQKWESTTERNAVGRPHIAGVLLPEAGFLRCMNQDMAVKHARRIFRDFTLFARIKALADFANDPHVLEFIRSLLPEGEKVNAEGLVTMATMSAWKQIKQMIQKRTAYKAESEPDWTTRGYNTVEGGAIIEGLLARLGEEPNTLAGKLLRDLVINERGLTSRRRV